MGRWRDLVEGGSGGAAGVCEGWVEQGMGAGWREGTKH